MDHQPLNQLVRDFQESWNRHDLELFARLFHADATFVNRFATYWRGRDSIVEGHRQIHATVYSDSSLAIEDPDVDDIGDDAAILHFWTRLTAGAAHPAGPHDVDCLLMAVATRRDGGWAFQAVQNVTYTDPRTGRNLLRQS